MKGSMICVPWWPSAWHTFPSKRTSDKSRSAGYSLTFVYKLRHLQQLHVTPVYLSQRRHCGKNPPDGQFNLSNAALLRLRLWGSHCKLSVPRLLLLIGACCLRLARLPPWGRKASSVWFWLGRFFIAVFACAKPNILLRVRFLGALRIIPACHCCCLVLVLVLSKWWSQTDSCPLSCFGYGLR